MKRKRAAPRRTLQTALIEAWEGWDAEIRRRTERERGLQAKNTQRQRKAERDYQKYRDIAEVLIGGNPQLRRATRHRLAKEVQAELVKQGRGVVSARTIW